MAKFYTFAFDAKTGVQSWTFANGSKLEFRPEDCNDEIRRQLMFHGARQKVTDSWSSCSKTKDFATAIANGERVIEALLAGNWKLSGGSMADLVVAFAEVMDITEEDAHDAVAAMDDEQLKKVTASKRVKKVIARLKLERLESASDDEDDGLEDLRSLVK